MGLSVTPDFVNSNVVGNKRHVPVSITFDSAYPADGEALTAAQCGLVVLERLIFTSPAINPDTPDLALIPRYNRTTKKVQLFESDDNAPFPEIGADDVSAYVVEAYAVGY